MPTHRPNGFTLSELLITLAILGLIAVFTIPKVLSSQQSSRNNAVAKEALSAISQAYRTYSLNNAVTASTSMADLTQYLNYVQYDTTSLVDHVPTLTSRQCDGTTYKCYRLASGAVIWHDVSTDYFGGTATTNAIEFYVDPDGVYSGSASGTGKSAQLYLYYNGRITSRAYILTGTVVGGTSKSASASFEPSWLQW